MHGSLVSLPVCGCDCLFVVSHNETLKTTHEESDLGVLPTSLPIYKVTHKTKITLVGPPSAKSTPLAEERQSQSLAARENEKPSGKIIEEVKYTSLGGLQQQIKEIKQVVHFSLLRPELLARYGLPPHRGILLHGPPGTGKSTLTRAAACEAGVPLFAVNGPDVVSQFYGRREEALRAVFTAAEEAAPSVVVIDEADAIAPERKDGSEELAQRMVGALLKLMDECGNKCVLVIACTNQSDTIDPALRHPGRFDKDVEIGVLHGLCFALQR